MHFIEEVFGEGCDLYDVLSCPRDADRAKLRKCYYRAALKYHPDRSANNSGGGGDDQNSSAHRQFQAISMCYQILGDDEVRAEYDETGVIPQDAPDDDDKTSGADQWKAYFDRIFGKVTRTDIEAFATKYKCSDEERRDVLKEFKARKGDLLKMLDYVMLSEFRDAIRWVEDYIRPAMESGELSDKFRATMEKTLVSCQKKADRERKAEEEGNAENESDEETETESEGMEEDNVSPPPSKRQTASSKGKKETPKKGKPTKAKAAKQQKKGKGSKNDMSDLVAQIQNRRGGSGGNMFASLGARYGVAMDDDDADPLADDAAFEKARAKLNNGKRRKK